MSKKNTREFTFFCECGKLNCIQLELSSFSQEVRANIHTRVKINKNVFESIGTMQHKIKILK
ncbi:unnamed protein product [marine sediment metagenome]|uniref:Uncharacterized protein n=1 Tax=marine sediment metagenome TaxID=412755 RepID=X1FZ68_9ZZZZ